MRMSSSRRKGFGSSFFSGSVKMLESGSGGHEISVNGLSVFVATSSAAASGSIDTSSSLTSRRSASVAGAVVDGPGAPEQLVSGTVNTSFAAL